MVEHPEDPEKDHPTGCHWEADRDDGIVDRMGGRPVGRPCARARGDGMRIIQKERTQDTSEGPQTQRGRESGRRARRRGAFSASASDGGQEAGTARLSCLRLRCNLPSLAHFNHPRTLALCNSSQRTIVYDKSGNTNNDTITTSVR